MKKQDQILFINKCAALFESGISMGESLIIIFGAEKSKKNKKIIGDIAKCVERGHSLSKSIILSQANFDGTLVSMIKSGENSGTLALSLRQASNIMEKSSNLKKKIAGAMVYPSFIAVATVAMTIFLVMYIFPKIIPLFSSMDIELPLMTKIVRFVYHFLSSHGLWLCLFSIIVALIFLIFYRKKNKFKFFVQAFFIKAPVLGESIKKYFLGISFRSMSMLLDSGRPLSSILDDMRYSAGLEPYKKAWSSCREKVIKGVSLSESMKALPNLFPDLVLGMVFMGEKSGSLSSMLSNISKIYDEDLDNFTKKISSLAEPVLMIVMGLVVGSVALSIILPIYEITNHLTK